MTTAFEDSTAVRAALVEMGVPTELAQRLRVMRDTAPGYDGNQRVSLEMTYTKVKNGFERQAACASINLLADDLDGVVADKTRMATFIACGMRATPAAQRSELPHWIREQSQAPAIAIGMSRASQLARKAA